MTRRPSPLYRASTRSLKAMNLSNDGLVQLCWIDPYRQWTRSELERRKAEYYLREFGFDFQEIYDHDVNNRAARVANGFAQARRS